jgi:hypothetical protein
MWKVEISGGCAGLAPLFHPFAFCCVFENSGIAVPICNEDASVRSKSDIGSSVEWATVVRLLAYSDGHDLLAQREYLITVEEPASTVHTSPIGSMRMLCGII